MNEELATWYNSDQNHARRALGRNTLTWIADNIPQNRTIFELGSGKGTEILSSRYNMVSVERNVMQRLKLPADLFQQHVKDSQRRGMSLGPVAMQWILNHIPLGSDIVELGSGLGTEILSYGYEMWSIEHNKAFLYKAKNATYIYAPLQADKWYDPRPIVASMPFGYKLLIIDGPRIRERLLDHFNMFAVEIPWLIDDVENPVNLDMAQQIATDQGRTLDVIHDNTSRKKKFAIMGPGDFDND